MGIQSENIGDVSGASVLVIDQACENSQLLVSLCRNGSEWLSPVGWTEKQKITLLDCRSQGGKTEIEIPAEFSKALVTGDTLTLTCSELDLTQDITWEGANLLTRPIADNKPAPAGIAGGFLSRFKSSKAAEITETKSEAELHAEEADRAAMAYREKMELATQAKEEAQAKALEAAREAEAALKMEAERIAEMERAAKAFEEAERLKQDGIRRVEEERRQEEARKAEEARRIEEARKREEAARAEAERKAALERYVAALDVTQNEESRLQSRLSRLKTDASALESQKSEKLETLSTLQDDLQLIEGKTETAREAYDKSVSKLDVLSHDLIEFQAKSDDLNIQSEDLRGRVAQADSEYLTAQKEAEMAIARAEEKRKLLETARAEKDTILESLSTVAGKLETQAKLVSDTTVKSQKLQSKYEKVQADLTNKSMNIEAIQSDAERLSDSVQTSRLEIEATQQAVEDCRIRQAAHQNAIQHLEAGGSPENMPEFDPETRFFSNKNDELDSVESHAEQETKGLFSRVRQSFARSKDPEISVDLEDVHLDDVIDPVEDMVEEAVSPNHIQAPFSMEDINVEPELKTAGFVRRHSKSLLAIGTILGGAVILGGGYLATQNSQSQTLTVKSSVPAPTQIASTAENVKIPAIKVPVLATEPVETQTVAIEPIDILPIKDVKIEKIPAISVPDIITTETPAATKPAKKVTTKPTVKASVAKVEKEGTISLPKSKSVQQNAIYMTRAQTRLKNLGFYNGPVNGKQTAETKEAMRSFQELYDLPKSDHVTSSFLTALLNAQAERKSALQYSAPKTAPVAVYQTLDTLNQTQTDQNTQYAEAKIDSDISTLAAVQTVEITNSDILMDVTTTQGEDLAVDLAISDSQQIQDVVKEATAPLVTTPSPAPAVQDVIVEAQRIKVGKPSYPRVAARKDYYVNVNIIVSYDIDSTGNVINPSIVSNDHTGRFIPSFEKAAIKAVKSQTFTPKTINGQPVTSSGQTQRIAFNAG